jgi:hypothetical protein
MFAYSTVQYIILHSLSRYQTPARWMRGPKVRYGEKENQPAPKEEEDDDDEE